MIGRAALANPWIFSRLDREQVTPEQVQQTVHEHLAEEHRILRRGRWAKIIPQICRAIFIDENLHPRNTQGDSASETVR